MLKLLKRIAQFVIVLVLILFLSGLALFLANDKATDSHVIAFCLILPILVLIAIEYWLIKRMRKRIKYLRRDRHV